MSKIKKSEAIKSPVKQRYMLAHRHYHGIVISDEVHQDDGFESVDDAMQAIRKFAIEDPEYAKNYEFIIVAYIPNQTITVQLNHQVELVTKYDE